MLMVNYLIGFGAGGETSASVAYTDSATDITNTSSYSYTSRSIGDASADRHVVVAIAVTAGGAVTVTGCTIAGISATQVIDVGTTNSRLALYIAAVPTGTTGTIAFTTNIAGARSGIGVWAVSGINSATPTATNTNTSFPSAASITVQSGGVLIGAAQSFNNASATYTWTNLTERYDAIANESPNFLIISGASDAFASGTTTTVTATRTGSAQTDSLVLAAFR